MAIFEEKVLEQFMPRGMGNSGVASREIQAGNLPNLSAAIRESAATMGNLEDQQRSSSKAISLRSMSSALSKMKSAGVGGGAQKPFVVGKIEAGGNGTTGGGYTIAIPDPDGGYTLQTIYTQPASNRAGAGDNGLGQNLENLKAFGIDLSKDYPSLGIAGLGGKYSGEDLAAQLLQYGRNSNGANISSVLSNIKYGGTSEKTNQGWAMLKGGVGADPVKLSRLAAMPLTDEQAIEKRNAAARKINGGF